MEKWVVYAFVSMLFAGFTSVIAKLGLAGISGELGLGLRTVVVLVLVMSFTLVAVPRTELAALTPANYGWLALSGVTTTLSWVFYYKALKLGEVSTIALIDKGSFIVAVLLAWLLLREQITLRVVAGCSLILAGLLVVARK